MLGALVEGRSSRVRAQFVPPAGVMAWCPCGFIAGLLADDPMRRWCVMREHRIDLNAEEVSWVISEMRSTAPSRRAA